MFALVAGNQFPATATLLNKIPARPLGTPGFCNAAIFLSAASGLHENQHPRPHRATLEYCRAGSHPVAKNEEILPILAGQDFVLTDNETPETKQRKSTPFLPGWIFVA